MMTSGDEKEKVGVLEQEGGGGRWGEDGEKEEGGGGDGGGRRGLMVWSMSGYGVKLM